MIQAHVFDKNNLITGLNIIDDLLFWTDNNTEPKKINISRCKLGTPVNPSAHTKLINEKQNISLTSNIDIEEKHITIIKKTVENIDTFFPYKISEIKKQFSVEYQTELNDNAMYTVWKRSETLD